MEKAIDSDQYEVSIELTVDASGSTCKKKASSHGGKVPQ